MRLCNNWNWSLLLRVNWDFKPYTLSRSLKQHPCMLFFVQVTESELGPSFVAVKIIVFLVRTWLSISRVNIRCATDGKPRLPVRVDWSIPTCSAEKGCAIEASNALAFSAYVCALHITLVSVKWNYFEIILKLFHTVLFDIHVIVPKTEIKLFQPLTEFWNYFEIISATLNVLEIFVSRNKLLK